MNLLIQEYLNAWALWWNTFLENPHLWIYAGSILMLIVLWIWARCRCSHDLVKVKGTEFGNVCIARSALQELIQSTCLQAGIIGRIKTKFKLADKKIHVNVSLHSPHGMSVHTLSTNIQSQLATTLSEHLGADHVGNINIVVVGFSPSNTSTHEKQSSMVSQETLESNSGVTNLDFRS